MSCLDAVVFSAKASPCTTLLERQVPRSRDLFYQVVDRQIVLVVVENKYNHISLSVVFFFILFLYRDKTHVYS